MTSFTMLPLLLMVAMMLLGRGSTKKVLSLQAMHGEYGSLNNDADSLSPAAGTGPNGGIRAAQTRPAKFQHDLYLNLKGDLWPVSKSPLATENLLEDTWWVASSPLSTGGGRRNPSVPSRCGRLLLSASADARSSDDVIALSKALSSQLRGAGCNLYKRCDVNRQARATPPRWRCDRLGWDVSNGGAAVVDTDGGTTLHPRLHFFQKARKQDGADVPLLSGALPKGRQPRRRAGRVGRDGADDASRDPLP